MWAKASRRVRSLIESLDRLGVHLAARIHGRHHELRACLLAQHLPGHDVRVMLEMGKEHLIARLEQGTTIALRDQIDGLGRAAHEHDLARRAGVDEARDALACALVQCRRFLAQRMHAAMDVGVMHPLVFVHRRDDAARALRGGAVVEISERLAVHRAAENREFTAYGCDVESHGCWSECGIHRKPCSVCESGSCRISSLSIATRAALSVMSVSTSARNA